MSTLSKLPYGTILRYTETRDQPKRTMLVLPDGKLRCLRVGEKTHKGNQLPTYPSLEAFLDIVPYTSKELFIIEFPRIDDDTVDAAEYYLNTLGKAGICSDEGGLLFHREAPVSPAAPPLSSYPPMDMTPPFLAPKGLLAAAPATQIDYEQLGRAPGGMGGGSFGSPKRRAAFQEPEPVSPPAHVDMSYLAYEDEGGAASSAAGVEAPVIPPPPWTHAEVEADVLRQASLAKAEEKAIKDAFLAKAVNPTTTVALTRQQLHRVMVLNGGVGITPELWVELLREKEGI